MSNKFIFPLFLSLLITVSCSRNSFKSGDNFSAATGWSINSKDGGGFMLNNKFKDQMTAPGMIFIQGGTFVKGNVKDNVMHDWNNTPTQQYVRSFFMDETEVTNGMYVEYLFWLKKMYGNDEDNPGLRQIWKNALPDTLVWRNPLGFNEDMVNNYLRYPAFRNHPVVGVSWKQATNYAKWRTDRVNILILANQGLINKDSIESIKEFNTKRYLLDPKNSLGENIEDFIGDKAVKETEGDYEYAGIEDGILLPEYRLPTETEWEYAALGLEEIRDENLYRGKKKFPWNGEYTRSQKKKNLGDQLANFKLGKGDYGGIANYSEVGSGITTNVRAYPANSFGLYGMGGNVSEWVADVYRPIIDEEANDFNYYRGNVYQENVITSDGYSITDKSNFNLEENKIKYKNGRIDFKSLPGEIKLQEPDSNSINRINYTRSDNRNFNDGDKESSREYEKNTATTTMYNSPDDNNKDIVRLSLINDDSRLYKGGSWLDRSYYLDPAQRRYLDAYMTSNNIGFRCAMSYLGEERNISKPKKR
tara:strand:+ start:3836 stop:5431 length:1596 start_codon:yes stop_codon:yes gene_type:complete